MSDTPTEAPTSPSPAELAVLVTADLARAPKVAKVPGLPEQIAEEAVQRVTSDLPRVQHALGLPPTASPLTCALLLARYLAAIGWQESRLGWNWLDKLGRGEDGFGYDEWQVDERSHPKEVAEIKALPARSLQRRSVALKHGCTILLDALACYPGNLEAGACVYNAGPHWTARGIAEHKDPNHFTTGHKYGREVVGYLKEWWPETRAA